MGGGIDNSQVVNEEGKYSLDAVQNNPGIEGSLRQVLNTVATDEKGYYKVGYFYMYRYDLGDKAHIKLNLFSPHNIIVFYGDYNNWVFNGTVAYNNTIVNNAGGANVSVDIDRTNSRITFNLGQWSTIYLMSTEPLSGVEKY